MTSFTAPPATQPMDASKLIYSYTTDPRDVPDEATAAKSNDTICTHHMIIARWKKDIGWSTLELKPSSRQCPCFEGLKAYSGDDGKLRLFRPDRNGAGLQMSAERISLPPAPSEELKKLILALLHVDAAKWFPRHRAGDFLYIQPTIIGSNLQLGVQAPTEALLYIIVGDMPRLDMMQDGKRLTNSCQDESIYV
ncbi:Aminotransferase class IV [Penicillium samsonianum]|uniref:Aminotransferase class IV n=1 Tax=Penicillium samsonianum TaxID=1882272 RepID=UPI002548C2E9|nr:Aminotransferase class IV [Penicillium samsonianum]KAJ6127942.1 Aminotransferase class IV [Penicillium samsonianum]